MDIKLLDPYVLSVLKKSNWFEARKVNVDSLIEQLESEGYRCFEYARKVLESLNGISVDEGPFGDYMGAHFEIDARNGSSEYDRLADFEAIAGEKLFPIGDNHVELIYVGESKHIYGGSWNHFQWLANNIEEYLNYNFIRSYPYKVLWSGDGSFPAHETDEETAD